MSAKPARNRISQTIAYYGPGQFAGVASDLIVTAYQSASGLVNLITPPRRW